ncbi:MAG: helix-turn-helix domain-containing protein [Thermodesulfobacteriota bacterium]
MGTTEQVVTPLAVAVAEAARLVGVSRSALYDLVSRGELPTARIGRRRVVLLEDLRAWLRAQREGA